MAYNYFLTVQNYQTITYDSFASGFKRCRMFMPIISHLNPFVFKAFSLKQTHENVQ